MINKVLGTTATAFLLLCSHALTKAIQRRSIPETTFANLQLFGQYAAAAYCPSNNHLPHGGTKLSCPVSNNCPLVEASDTKTVYEFENSLVTDVTGFIAVDHTHSLIVLAFRGSHGIQNWLANLRVTRVDTDICEDCSCHRGFWYSWREARTGITAILQNTQVAYPAYNVIVTGHSLGGAVAAIAAAEIRKSGVRCDLYTYGAPRAGGKGLCDYISNPINGSSYRVTHTDDPVPRLPPRHWDYRHTDLEYYIAAPTNITPSAQDITVHVGNEYSGGNTQPRGQLPGHDVDAHLWYFNGIAQCAPGGIESEILVLGNEGLNLSQTLAM